MSQAEQTSVLETLGDAPVLPEGLRVRSGVSPVSTVLIVLAALASLVFVFLAAVPYFAFDEAQFGGYWPRRGWLVVHVATGIVALLAGPVQLWLGVAHRNRKLHRALGKVYMAAIAVAAASAYYLAVATDNGWVFGAGLAGLATAWLVTTSLAFVAIRRRLFEQHREWMIRSYVVTFAFVSFRVLFTALDSAEIGTLEERLALASWFCWALPLLATEAVLQGRKIISARAPLLR